MTTTICTLFEGDYHAGVAVLVNSLCRAGYRGVVHAGYRGDLPLWTDSRDRVTAGEVEVVFHRISTPAHFTNYKPDFMLELLAGPAAAADAIFYCDPDIVINERWQMFEQWVSCGIALCEDVNSPFPRHHPRRAGWRRFYAPHGFVLTPGETSYANGGFVGVPRPSVEFLSLWRTMGRLVFEYLGGTEVVGIAGGRTIAGQMGFYDCFRQPDQDALNAAIEAAGEKFVFSFLGRQAMGFESGHPAVPHALGPAKPWRRKYLREELTGRPPAGVDKLFWACADGPLRPFSSSRLKSTRWALRVASALGRIYRRR